MTPIHLGGIYIHVKTGNPYKVVAIAKDSETLEDMVVYEALYDNRVGKFWIRSLVSFIGEATSPDGTVHPRFKYEKQSA